MKRRFAIASILAILLLSIGATASQSPKRTKYVNTSKLEKKETLSKHRYLYPLDRAMRKQIAPLAKSYPKRETCGQSIEGDIAVPTEGLGSIPGGRSNVATGVQAERVE